MSKIKFKGMKGNQKGTGMSYFNMEDMDVVTEGLIIKKVFTVEVETKQPLIEPFWMYRGFGYDKDEAIKCAELLSTFFPYYEYATKVIVYVEDEIQETEALINKTILKEYYLKDENGNIVT